MKKKPKYHQAFIQQKKNAKKRGIPWEISFKDWLTIWQKSGKLHLRGKGKGKYCLARYGDKGPYSRINVFVQEFIGNLLDGKHRNARIRRKTMVPISQLPAPNWFA